MGGYRNINHEEAKAVEELRNRVKKDLTPVMRDDPTLFYRFLKARDFNIDKAEKFLRKNITRRKTYQADTILQDFKPNEFFEKYAVPSFIGFDKDGDAVFYFPTGNIDVPEIYKSVKMNNLMKHYTWFSEKCASTLQQNNKKTGNCGYQASLIFDMNKLTLRNATSKLTFNLFLHIIHLYQDNYPERLKFVYLTNVPSYYIYGYSIIKTLMASATVEKIHIFNYDGWKERLLEFIDADVLPAFLGGTRTDPDGNPFCSSFIWSGGKIPEKYFLTDKCRYFQSNAQIKKITLSNQEKKEIKVDIEKEGLILEWEFLVMNKDIKFGVSFQNSEKEIQEVIPIHRYDTSDGTEKDSYKCHSTGTYIIIFDNSYSWLNSKTVEYVINVVKPTA